jgi:hypothetical protein
VFARSLTTGVALATLVALASSVGVAAASASPASPHSHSSVVPTSDGGRGASVGFTEYSAVGSESNGTVIGPSYNLYARAANAVDLRYSTGLTSTAA